MCVFFCLYVCYFELVVGFVGVLVFDGVVDRV